jgi:RNase P subunit RPR2
MDSSKRADEPLAFQQIKDTLCGVCCPHCDHHNQTLTLRIQAADGLTIAECAHCRTEFVVVNDKLRAIKTAEKHLSARLRSVPCPGCDSPLFALRFRCDLRDGSCFFMAHCLTCGHVYRVIHGSEALKLVEIS